MGQAFEACWGFGSFSILHPTNGRSGYSVGLHESIYSRATLNNIMISLLIAKRSVRQKEGTFIVGTMLG